MVRATFKLGKRNFEFGLEYSFEQVRLARGRMKVTSNLVGCRVACVLVAAWLWLGCSAGAEVVRDDVQPNSATFIYINGNFTPGGNTNLSVPTAAFNDETFDGSPNVDDIVGWFGQTAGTFDVYVHWVRFNTHDSNVSYIVGTGPEGSVTPVTPAIVDQRQFGNQQTLAANPLGIDATNNSLVAGSGWFNLGTFDFQQTDNDEFVSVNHNGAVDGFLIADAVRFRNAATEGILLDERVVAAATAGSTWTNVATDDSTDPDQLSIQYAFTTNPDVELWYDPGIDAAGIYNVRLSWGAHEAQTTAVDYLVDFDGDLLTTLDQVLLEDDIDQTLLADGSSAGNIASWSGFTSGVEALLGPDSLIVARRDNIADTLPFTADLLQITFVSEPAQVPEPAALFVFSTAMLFMIFRPRRS